MGNLTSALRNAASAQRTFDRALLVIQANVSNVYTPGWAKQRPTIDNAPFDPAQGLPGGIRPGMLQDSRSRYAEAAVRERQGALNFQQQRKSDLQRIERIFDLNGKETVPETITAFFKSMSQLSVTPNDRLARETVIERANGVARSFVSAAMGLSSAQSTADRQINDAVESINTRIARLREINESRRSGSHDSQDAGLDAQVYTTLEELAQYASVQPIFQPDGSVSVYLSGRTPLLVGNRQWKIQPDPSASAATIRNSDGNDITQQITDGKLGGLLQLRNQNLPEYVSDLNRLAKEFADQVNQVQRSGVTPAGTPPAGDIFAYNSAQGEALTLNVTALDPADLAAALPTAPGGNGNALNFAALGSARTIDGLSFNEFFGSVGARFGRDLGRARAGSESGQLLLSQARAYRDELSAVSLDESAAELIQYQRAYQASAELFRVLNQLTETTLGMLR